jgi:hypothetical protein
VANSAVSTARDDLGANPILEKGLAQYFRSFDTPFEQAIDQRADINASANY